MNLHFPSKCPVCLFQIREPVGCCQRCGCNLLLLAKVQNESLKWKEQGKEVCSRALQ